MKLLNHTLSYFAAILFVVITCWAGLFYYNLIDEIYDSLDDGLDNYKLLIIRDAAADSTILHKGSFGKDNYAIKSMATPQALTFTDVYSDTAMFMENEQDFEPVRMLRTVFRQNERFYELRVINTMIETDDLVKDLLYSILWLYLGLIASILIVNNLVLKKIWQPFYQLLHQLKRFRLEDQALVQFGDTKVEEFLELNDAVAKLLQNNTDTYSSQKQFIENASHELQTPLAISLNKLELLLEQTQLTEEQLQLLAGVINNLERMTRLNKSLLLLSKIENRQFHTEEEVNLNSLAKTLLEDFADQAAYKGIAVSFEEDGICHVRMNPDLASILLTNLIKNAMVHNHPGGFVKVRLQLSQLTVENSGPAGPLNERKMFARFHREDHHASSTGLGLPIVKAITSRYGFRIKYSYGQNHILTVNFE